MRSPWTDLWKRLNSWICLEQILLMIMDKQMVWATTTTTGERDRESEREPVLSKPNPSHNAFPKLFEWFSGRFLLKGRGTQIIGVFKKQEEKALFHCTLVQRWSTSKKEKVKLWIFPFWESCPKRQKTHFLFCSPIQVQIWPFYGIFENSIFKKKFIA